MQGDACNIYPQCKQNLHNTVEPRNIFPIAQVFVHYVCTLHRHSVLHMLSELRQWELTGCCGDFAREVGTWTMQCGNKSACTHAYVHVMCLRILVGLNQICKSLCGVSLLNFWQARQGGNSG